MAMGPRGEYQSPLHNRHVDWNWLYMLAFGALFMIYIWVNSTVWYNRLLAHPVIYNGATVVSVDRTKYGWCLKYSFVLDGKIYSEHTPNENFSRFPGDFVGRHFPVAYQRGEPRNSELLLREEEFEEFKLGYPDSLKWVLGYIKN